MPKTKYINAREVIFDWKERRAIMMDNGACLEQAERMADYYIGISMIQTCRECVHMRQDQCAEFKVTVSKADQHDEKNDCPKFDPKIPF